MRRRSRTWLLLPALVVACNGDERAVAPVTSGPWPPFTVRGRLADAKAIPVRIDATGGPVEAATFTAAIERALGAWSATGAVSFEPQADPTAPAVLLRWARGHHGACEPFGPSAVVAHAGPVARDSFVHFDAARTWSSEALQRTALHELGHVLGLGHCERSDAVMSSGTVVPDQPGTADVAGIHSLYGGGDGSHGDLLVTRTNGDRLATVHAIAPPTVAFAGFDVDDDGDDDLVLWRTDRDGNGAMLMLHFAAGPRLQRTHGPLLGVVPAGAQVAFARNDDGRAMLLLFTGDEVGRALVFDAHGGLEPADSTVPAAALRARAQQQRRPDDTLDLDGDGVRERVDRADR